jgi:CheY-like chemotaxis protein
LRQVLTNLLNNALKFTDAGYIRFGYEKSGRYLQFFVKDSGIGIPPELHEKIFEPFRQAEIEISSQYGGTGLGLSISAKLVGMLGGKIWLKSAPGMGSTFYFTVPLQAQEFTETIKEEPPRIADLDGLELTILVAEDDDVNYLYLSTILSKGKIKMVRARNGVEALELCKTKPDIQLVLLDIKMPVMSGYEAAKKIKQIRTDLPIIAQTAFAMNEDRRKALASGCDAYLSKPIKKEELLGFIDKLARKNQAEA